MKKRLVLALLISLAVVGCGKTNNKSEEDVSQSDYAESLGSTLRSRVSGISEGEAHGEPNKEDMDFAKRGEKGTIDNPYSIGDEIHIADVYGWGDYISTSITIDFMVEAKVTPEKYQEYEIQPNQSGYYELIKIKYKLSGDIAGNIEYFGMPYFGMLSDQKVELADSVWFVDKDFNKLQNIYADNEYSGWGIGENNAKYDYAFIRFVTETGVRTIFVSLE